MLTFETERALVAHAAELLGVGTPGVEDASGSRSAAEAAS